MADRRPRRPGILRRHADAVHPVPDPQHLPEPNRRRLAVAIWAAGFSGGAALGPIFGGWLVEHFWWGAVLLVAVPIILPLLVLGPA